MFSGYTPESPSAKFLYMFNPDLSTIPRLVVAFIASAIIPAAVGLILFERQGSEQTLKHTRQHLESLAIDREQLLKVHIGSLQQSASALANSKLVRRYLESLAGDAGQESVEASSGELAEDLLHATQREWRGKTHHVFLTDVTGRVVMSPPRSEYEGNFRLPFHPSPQKLAALGGHLGDSIGDKDFFADALEDASITNFSSIRGNDHDHQLLLHPVKDSQGQAVGVVVVEVAVDALKELLSNGTPLGKSGKVTLATHTGRRVIHRMDGDAGVLDSEGLRQSILSGELTFGEFRVDGNRDVFGVYLPSTTHPWIVCIEIDQEEFRSASGINKSFMAQVLALIAVAMGIIGMLLGTWFGKPLQRLSAAAQRVSEGHIEISIPVTRGLDEIGKLERAVESMRVRLYEQILTLDRRIEGKTLQLAQLLDEVQTSKDRYALAVRGSKEGLWDWDLEAETIYYAPRWKELLGRTQEEVGDTLEAWIELIVPNGRKAFQAELNDHLESELDQFDTEVEMLHSDGNPRWMLCRAASIRNKKGRVVRFAGSLADITDTKRAQRELARMAQHDQLTGLANRELFVDRLKQTMARSRRHTQANYGVLFFDFDRFKVINDSLGHNAGDALLVSIADRFREELREVDTAARFGGDEFVVILDSVADLAAAESMCERLLRAFSKPHQILGHAAVSTASIGLVMGDEAYKDAASILRDADTAMYQAKTGGRAQFRVFDREMHSNAVQRLNLENDLRNSDYESEFRIYYQSIVSLDTAEVTGFEALVRWEHPTLGLVSPDDFIPIAEETGLIVPLGEWILHTATAQLKAWQGEFHREGTLSMNINLARRQLLHPSLPATLKALTEEFDLKPGDVKLEITETTVMDERHDMIPAMDEIRAMGFPLAMDDFGTGHSSLGCLHAFPIDVLKIDRDFIKNLGDSREFTAVVQAIVTLAHHLDLEVVAEGVETAGQLAQLQVLGCQYAQGYLFSKPLPAASACELLREGLPRVA
ncbi:MAG: diguanylate cyclase (GGDEF)-like protein/PAS domain S-box-containing protein [Glaciecola sp.]|jgi:diguanylate cyclase (GGDEF)-like protein/PAS domain S-box-containing protein